MQSGFPVGLETPQVAHSGLVAAVAVESGLLRRRVIAALAADGITSEVQNGHGVPDADVVIFARTLGDGDRLLELKNSIAALGEAPVVVVSGRASGASIRRALRANARGIVFDSELDRALVATIRAVLGGQTCVPREVKLAVDKPTLSHREREVLKLAVLGRTNGEIAAALCLAESTVKSHLSSAFNRLGVRSRREAATLVLDPEEGLGPIILGTNTALPGLAGGAFARS